MSWWTYVKGAVEVHVPGRTQAEIRYILESVLDHLPRVTGSEGDMNVHIVQEAGFDSMSSADEFYMFTNNLKTEDGSKSYKHGWLATQNTYMLVVEGDLRDRDFETTKREFVKWMCRLSKRLHVQTVVVKIYDYDRSFVISDQSPFDLMFECDDDDIRWTDYLMWERDPRSGLPLQLVRKYLNDQKVNTEMKRREEWHDSLYDDEPEEENKT